MDSEIENGTDDKKRRWPFYFIGFAIVICLILMLSTLKYHTKQMEQPFHTVTYEVNNIDFQDPPQVKKKSVRPAKHLLVLVPVPTPVVADELHLEDTALMNNAFSNDPLVADLKPEESDEPFIYENKVYTKVDEMPRFHGGNYEKFREWIAQNLKYPEIAIENGISGKVSIGFCIDSKGDVCEVTVLRGIDPYLDQEAIRVIKSSPQWLPGKLKGKTVKVHYDIQVDFELN